MPPTDQIIIVKTSVNSPKVAKHIAKLLVKEHLVACAQVVPRVTSFFHWQGKLSSAQEYIVFLKSKQTLYTKISARIKELHPYETPEILSWQIAEANKEYSDWLFTELT